MEWREQKQKKHTHIATVKCLKHRVTLDYCCCCCVSVFYMFLSLFLHIIFECYARILEFNFRFFIAKSSFRAPSIYWADIRLNCVIHLWCFVGMLCLSAFNIKAVQVRMCTWLNIAYESVIPNYIAKTYDWMANKYADVFLSTTRTNNRMKPADSHTQQK